MMAVDVQQLARHISSRFGLPVDAAESECDGGRFPSLRPRELPDAGGFSIVLAPAPKNVLALFEPDAYAGPLLRAMADADPDCFATFVALAAAAESRGVVCRLTADGKALPCPADLAERRFAHRLEIECSRRLSSRNPNLADAALDVATVCMALVLALLPLRESDPEEVQAQGLPEGGQMTVLVNRYERSPSNRAACLAFHGTRCRSCGFDFADFYGELGEGFVEVHHVVPVSQLGGSCRIDPILDLVPLCSNCHSMVHRTNPPISPEALRERLEGRQMAAVRRPL